MAPFSQELEPPQNPGRFSESFVENCLPDFVQLRHHLDALEKQLDDRSQQHKNFEQWRAHGEAIEVQFRKLH